MLGAARRQARPAAHAGLAGPETAAAHPSPPSRQQAHRFLEQRRQRHRCQRGHCVLPALQVWQVWYAADSKVVEERLAVASGQPCQRDEAAAQGCARKYSPNKDHSSKEAAADGAVQRQHQGRGAAGAEKRWKAEQLPASPGRPTAAAAEAAAARQEGSRPRAPPVHHAAEAGQGELDVKYDHKQNCGRAEGMRLDTEAGRWLRSGGSRRPVHAWSGKPRLACL